MGVKAGAFGLRVEDDRVVVDDGNWWSEFVKGFIPVQFILRIFQISLGQPLIFRCRVSLPMNEELITSSAFPVSHDGFYFVFFFSFDLFWRW